MDTSAVINVNVQSNDTPQAQYKTVVLKPNMVDDVNTLTQAMLTAHGQNTKFVIKYDFTLGEDITVPANCVLEFDGGSISASGSNDTITGANTGIQAGLVKIFNTNVTLAGTWNVAEAYSEWFDNDVNKSLSINKCLQTFNICKLSNKTYSISSPIYINSDYCKLVGCGNDSMISVANNFNIVSDDDITKTRIDGRVDFYNAAIMIRPGNYGDADIVTTDLVHWCEISNFRIEGNDIIPTGVEMWLLASNVNNLVIRGTNKEALLLRRGWNNKFSNINCNYNNGNGFVLESECNANLLERIEIDHYGDVGILVNQGMCISVINCDVEDGNTYGILFSPKQFTELESKNNDVVPTNIIGFDIVETYFESIGIDSQVSDSSAICIKDGNNIVNGSIKVSGVTFNRVNRCFYIGDGIIDGITIFPYHSFNASHNNYLGYINGQRLGHQSNITINDIETNWDFYNDYESRQVCFIHNNETGTKTFNGINLSQKKCVLKQAGDIDRYEGRIRYYLDTDKYIFLNTVRKFAKTVSGVTFTCYYSCGMITIVATGTATEAISTDISFSDSPFSIANDLGSESFISQAGDGTGTIQTRDYNILYADIASGQVVNKRITYPSYVG